MLIIRFSALGDVAMTIPVIYSVARQYPGERFDVVTRPFFAGLFINAPENVHVIPADFKESYRGAAGMRRLLHDLRALRPDCVACLHKPLAEKVPQTGFITRYADVMARLGFPVELTFRSLYDHTPARPPFEPEHPAVGIAPFARYYNRTYPPTFRLGQRHRPVHLRGRTICAGRRTGADEPP